MTTGAPPYGCHSPELLRHAYNETIAYHRRE
jgi:hypothetical protein